MKQIGLWNIAIYRYCLKQDENDSFHMFYYDYPKLIEARDNILERLYKKFRKLPGDNYIL